MGRIYLDDAGSAAVLPEVLAALESAPWANASSPHTEGRIARAALDAARDTAARALAAVRTDITFTSSGTEAVNLAIAGVAHRLPRAGRIVTWAAEHQSVLGAVRHLQAEGRAVEILPVDRQGRADPSDLAAGAALVSIGLANNEVGAIQPVEEVIERAHALGARVHVDACCGPRWIPIPAGADLVSVSGHKLGAGRGGLLCVRDGVRLEPMQYGGPQEWGRRAGAEDVGAAVAVAAALDACALRRDRQAAHARPLAEALQAVLDAAGGTRTCSAPALPNHASGAFSGRKGEDLLMALDLAGIAASSGSACASGSLDPSHVLIAMGMDLDQAGGSLRLTVGYDSTQADIDRACEVIAGVLSGSRAHV